MSLHRVQPRPRASRALPVYPRCIAVAATLMLGGCDSTSSASTGGDIAVPFDGGDADVVDGAAEDTQDVPGDDSATPDS